MKLEARRRYASRGFALAEGSCPSLETAADKQQLVGKLVLVGWNDGEDFYRWFVGTIHSTTITVRDLFAQDPLS